LLQDKYKDQVKVIFNSECVKIDLGNSVRKTVLSVQGTAMVKPVGGTRMVGTDETLAGKLSLLKFEFVYTWHL
jgi:hypothetical protein